VKPRVLVTRPIPDAGLLLLKDHCDLRIRNSDLPPSVDELCDLIADCDGLLCLLTDPVSREVIAAAPRLRVISTFAVGFDNIDIAAAAARGIPVGHTPGVLTETTADLAFSLLLAAARRLVEAARFAADGHWKSWSPTLLLGRDVAGATLGIVGMGRIGLAVARRARGFAMKVLYCGPHNKDAADAMGCCYVPFEQLLAESDFVSLHAPLLTSTKNLIDRPALSRMKRTAILINTARGGCVDHDALTEALAQGQIAAAALDVTDPEPLPREHPLYAEPRCLIVPHLGSATVDTRNRMARMAAENLLAGLRGEPLPFRVPLPAMSEG